jgi:hypothetical protein
MSNDLKIRTNAPSTDPAAGDLLQRLKNLKDNKVAQSGPRSYELILNPKGPAKGFNAAIFNATSDKIPAPAKMIESNRLGYTIFVYGTPDALLKLEKSVEGKNALNAAIKKASDQSSSVAVDAKGNIFIVDTKLGAYGVASVSVLHQMLLPNAKTKVPTAVAPGQPGFTEPVAMVSSASGNPSKVTPTKLPGIELTFGHRDLNNTDPSKPSVPDFQASVGSKIAQYQFSDGKHKGERVPVHGINQEEAFKSGNAAKALDLAAETAKKYPGAVIIMDKDWPPKLYVGFVTVNKDDEFKNSGTVRVLFQVAYAEKGVPNLVAAETSPGTINPKFAAPNRGRGY